MLKFETLCLRACSCFLCNKAKAITGQVRQGSGRTAKPRAAGPGMLLPLPVKEKKDEKVSYLRSLDVQRRASNHPTHSQPCKGAHRKEAGMSGDFLWLSIPEVFNWFIQELQVQGHVWRLSTMSTGSWERQLVTA